VIGHKEEGRYVELRSRWQTNLGLKFFLLFQAQAILDIVLSLPFLLVAREGGEIGFIEAIAVALWAVAIVGEAAADYQLARFKRTATSRGRVCDVGLWRCSRHPNYFFEWLIWVAYALYASTVPLGWLDGSPGVDPALPAARDRYP
jgi:steroid 5-alpha reductase family enzyme